MDSQVHDLRPFTALPEILISEKIFRKEFQKESGGSFFFISNSGRF